MTRRINSLALPCGCHVWRFRRRWIPDHVCASHADKPTPTALDYLRRRLTQQEIAS